MPRRAPIRCVAALLFLASASQQALGCPIGGAEFDGALEEIRLWPCEGDDGCADADGYLMALGYVLGAGSVNERIEKPLRRCMLLAIDVIHDGLSAADRYRFNAGAGAGYDLWSTNVRRVWKQALPEHPDIGALAAAVDTARAMPVTAERLVGVWRLVRLTHRDGMTRIVDEPNAMTIAPDGSVTVEQGGRTVKGGWQLDPPTRGFATVVNGRPHPGRIVTLTDGTLVTVDAQGSRGEFVRQP